MTPATLEQALQSARPRATSSPIPSTRAWSAGELRRDPARYAEQFRFQVTASPNWGVAPGR
jgi:hypothetical protein